MKWEQMKSSKIQENIWEIKNGALEKSCATCFILVKFKTIDVGFCSTLQ